jgi:drug/metabolite transporter (DMT)-like permease
VFVVYLALSYDTLLIMKQTSFMLLLLTVVGISSGQILFKKGALGLANGFKPWELLFSIHIVAGLIIYGVSTVIWIYLLREVPLSRAYPVFALSFVIVPIISWFLFKETVDKTYFAGILFIVIGVILTTR